MAVSLLKIANIGSLIDSIHCISNSGCIANPCLHQVLSKIVEDTIYYDFMSYERKISHLEWRILFNDLQCLMENTSQIIRSPECTTKISLIFKQIARIINYQNKKHGVFPHSKEFYSVLSQYVALECSILFSSPTERLIKVHIQKRLVSSFTSLLYDTNRRLTRNIKNCRTATLLNILFIFTLVPKERKKSCCDYLESMAVIIVEELKMMGNFMELVSQSQCFSVQKMLRLPQFRIIYRFFQKCNKNMSLTDFPPTNHIYTEIIDLTETDDEDSDSDYEDDSPIFNVPQKINRIMLKPKQNNFVMYFLNALAMPIDNRINNRPAQLQKFLVRSPASVSAANTMKTTTSELNLSELFNDISKPSDVFPKLAAMLNMDLDKLLPGKPAVVPKADSNLSSTENVVEEFVEEQLQPLLRAKKIIPKLSVDTSESELIEPANISSTEILIPLQYLEPQTVEDITQTCSDFIPECLPSRVVDNHLLVKSHLHTPHITNVETQFALLYVEPQKVQEVTFDNAVQKVVYDPPVLHTPLHTIHTDELQISNTTHTNFEIALKYVEPHNILEIYNDAGTTFDDGVQEFVIEPPVLHTPLSIIHDDKHQIANITSTNFEVALKYTESCNVLEMYDEAGITFDDAVEELVYEPPVLHTPLIAIHECELQTANITRNNLEVGLKYTEPRDILEIYDEEGITFDDVVQELVYEPPILHKPLYSIHEDTLQIANITSTNFEIALKYVESRDLPNVFDEVVEHFECKAVNSFSTLCFKHKALPLEVSSASQLSTEVAVVHSEGVPLESVHGLELSSLPNGVTPPVINNISSSRDEYGLETGDIETTACVPNEVDVSKSKLEKCNINQVETFLPLQYLNKPLEMLGNHGISPIQYCTALCKEHQHELHESHMETVNVLQHEISHHCDIRIPLTLLSKKLQELIRHKKSQAPSQNSSDLDRYNENLNKIEILSDALASSLNSKLKPENGIIMHTLNHKQSSETSVDLDFELEDDRSEFPNLVSQIINMLENSAEKVGGATSDVPNNLDLLATVADVRSKIGGGVSPKTKRKYRFKRRRAKKLKTRKIIKNVTSDGVYPEHIEESNVYDHDACDKAVRLVEHCRQDVNNTTVCCTTPPNATSNLESAPTITNSFLSNDPLQNEELKSKTIPFKKRKSYRESDEIESTEVTIPAVSRATPKKKHKKSSEFDIPYRRVTRSVTAFLNMVEPISPHNLRARSTCRFDDADADELVYSLTEEYEELKNKTLKHDLVEMGTMGKGDCCNMSKSENNGRLGIKILSKIADNVENGETSTTQSIISNTIDQYGNVETLSKDVQIKKVKIESTCKSPRSKKQSNKGTNSIEKIRKGNKTVEEMSNNSKKGQFDQHEEEYMLMNEISTKILKQNDNFVENTSDDKSKKDKVINNSLEQPENVRKDDVLIEKAYNTMVKDKRVIKAEHEFDNLQKEDQLIEVEFTKKDTKDNDVECCKVENNLLKKTFIKNKRGHIEVYDVNNKDDTCANKMSSKKFRSGEQPIIQRRSSRKSVEMDVYKFEDDDKLIEQMPIRKSKKNSAKKIQTAKTSKYEMGEKLVEESLTNNNDKVNHKKCVKLVKKTFQNSKKDGDLTVCGSYTESDESTPTKKTKKDNGKDDALVNEMVVKNVTKDKKIKSNISKRFDKMHKRGMKLLFEIADVDRYRTEYEVVEEMPYTNHRSKLKEMAHNKKGKKRSYIDSNGTGDKASKETPIKKFKNENDYDNNKKGDTVVEEMVPNKININIVHNEDHPVQENNTKDLILHKMDICKSLETNKQNTITEKGALLDPYVLIKALDEMQLQSLCNFQEDDITTASGTFIVDSEVSEIVSSSQHCEDFGLLALDSIEVAKTVFSTEEITIQTDLNINELETLDKIETGIQIRSKTPEIITMSEAGLTRGLELTLFTKEQIEVTNVIGGVIENSGIIEIEQSSSIQLISINNDQTVYPDDCQSVLMPYSDNSEKFEMESNETSNSERVENLASPASTSSIMHFDDGLLQKLHEKNNIQDALCAPLTRIQNEMYDQHLFDGARGKISDTSSKLQMTPNQKVIVEFLPDLDNYEFESTALNQRACDALQTTRDPVLSHTIESDGSEIIARNDLLTENEMLQENADVNYLGKSAIIQMLGESTPILENVVHDYDCAAIAEFDNVLDLNKDMLNISNSKLQAITDGNSQLVSIDPNTTGLMQHTQSPTLVTEYAVAHSTRAMHRCLEKYEKFQRHIRYRDIDTRTISTSTKLKRCKRLNEIIEYLKMNLHSKSITNPSLMNKSRVQVDNTLLGVLDLSIKNYRRHSRKCLPKKSNHVATYYSQPNWEDDVSKEIGIVNLRKRKYTETYIKSIQTEVEKAIEILKKRLEVIPIKNFGNINRSVNKNPNQLLKEPDNTKFDECAHKRLKNNGFEESLQDVYEENKQSSGIKNSAFDGFRNVELENFANETLGNTSKFKNNKTKKVEHKIKPIQIKCGPFKKQNEDKNQVKHHTLGEIVSKNNMAEIAENQAFGEVKNNVCNQQLEYCTNKRCNQKMPSSAKRKFVDDNTNDTKKLYKGKYGDPFESECNTPVNYKCKTEVDRLKHVAILKLLTEKPTHEEMEELQKPKIIEIEAWITEIHSGSRQMSGSFRSFPIIRRVTDLQVKRLYKRRIKSTRRKRADFKSINSLIQVSPVREYNYLPVEEYASTMNTYLQPKFFVPPYGNTPGLVYRNMLLPSFGNTPVAALENIAIPTYGIVPGVLYKNMPGPLCHSHFNTFVCPRYTHLPMPFIPPAFIDIPLLAPYLNTLATIASFLKISALSNKDAKIPEVQQSKSNIVTDKIPAKKGKVLNVCVVNPICRKITNDQVPRETLPTHPSLAVHRHVQNPSPTEHLNIYHNVPVRLGHPVIRYPSPTHVPNAVQRPFFGNCNEFDENQYLYPNNGGNPGRCVASDLERVQCRGRVSSTSGHLQMIPQQVRAHLTSNSLYRQDTYTSNQYGRSPVNYDDGATSNAVSSQIRSPPVQITSNQQSDLQMAYSDNSLEHQPLTQTQPSSCETPCVDFSPLITFLFNRKRAEYDDRAWLEQIESQVPDALDDRNVFGPPK